MKRLLLVGIVLVPVLFGQKREDILSIQRDVASLQDQVRQLQKSQDDRMAAMQALLQQAVDASSKLASGMTALQHDVDAKLNDQQNKLVAPLANTNTKIDQQGDDLRSVATNVADLVRRVNGLDTKLADLKSLVQAMQAPPAPPPAVVGQTTPAASGPCAASAETIWSNAQRDESGGKLDMAMEGYSNYVKCYPDTENAPGAQYKIGYMYFTAAQYDDAVQAFDSVLERWPENPKTPEALYYKAVALHKAHHPTDAGKAYKDYIAKYPRGEHVQQAHANLRTLGLESTRPGSRKK
ncbi:MAG: tetratricopeptide repeat protein [Acidobacteriia bacterium]|nr:tetratricopeptide repeat protein [Terriglobia bacterium]